MSAGTIKLTNGSTAVVGTGTAFTSDLKSGDVITATVGGIFFTLFVNAVTSNTALTLTDPFTGPTTSGLAWVAVPQLTLNRITAALAAQTAESVRRVLQESANWQAFYSGTGDITVTLPDGTPTGRPVTGPSWPKMSGMVNSAVQWRGKPAATENINTYGPTSAYIGQWGFSSSGTLMSNGFPENGALGILEVFAGGRFSGSQRFVSHSGSEYYRTLTAAWNGTDGPWGDWLLLGVNTRPGFFAGDLNTLVTPGYWAINSSATNGPADKGIGGICEVILRSNATQVIQRFSAIETSAAYNNRTWQRALSGTGTWSPWDLQGTAALNDLGLGTPVSQIAGFDWQAASFQSGSILNVNSANWVNPPPLLSSLPGTSFFLQVTGRAGMETASGAWVMVTATQLLNSGARRVFNVCGYGAIGSRVFTTTEIFSTNTTIPIANGGTGAKTPTDARKAISASVGGVTVSGAFSNIISVDPGFYSINGGNFSDPANGDFGSLFSAGTYGSGLNGQIFIRNDGTSLLYRGGSNATVRTVYSTANTTVDSNGFIKKSSPVINIFSDGRCINNDESEGVTVTRQAVGVYLLEGCMGLNADAAWGGIDGGFEIPLDRNKQPRIWLDYEVSQDGSVLVKTYHRTHPSAPKFARNECEGIADGDPVDIPADSFISVRIEMPEDSIYNKKMEEAEQKLAEEEADRIRAEQERQKTEVDPKEQPDVQQ